MRDALLTAAEPAFSHHYRWVFMNLDSLLILNPDSI